MPSDNPEKYVFSTLTGDTDVMSILVSAANVSPMYRNSSIALPCVVYKVVSETAMDALDGYVGMSQYRLELACMSNTYTQAKTLADKVRLALDEKPGKTESTNIQLARYDSSRDVYDKPRDGGNVGVHRCILEFIFFSYRTSP